MSHSEVVRVTRSVLFMRAKMIVGKRVVVTTSGIWKILERGDCHAREGGHPVIAIVSVFAMTSKARVYWIIRLRG